MAKRMSISDMNATAELYGSNVTVGKVSRSIFAYEAALLAFTYVLYGQKGWYCIVIWALICAVYVYRGLIPRQVKASYKRKGEAARNRFINYVTQEMSTGNSNIINAIRSSSHKIHGEFREDLDTLLATIMSTTDYKVTHKAFQNIQDKYQDDIYFVLFMEQVETVYRENEYHIETFITFKDSHNAVLQKEKDFIMRKNQVQSGLYSILVISWFTVAICLIFPGYDKYIRLYTGNIFGIAISTIYLVVIAIIIRNFYRKYFDDDVLHF